MGNNADMDYGPLGGLIGTWTGDKGRDLSPEPDGTEENLYYESLEFAPAGSVENAEEQELAVLRYHQLVTRKENTKVIHEQVGYWTWDPVSKTIAHSFVIPRRVCVLASAEHSGEAGADGKVVFTVSARAEGENPGIIQGPFMMEKARTLAFDMELTLQGNRLTYSQTTLVEIYGRKQFEHTDTNELVRQG